MIRHSGAHKFCPNCKAIVETRVLANGYKQVRYHGGYAKQRKIICAKDRRGTGGCGHTWNSYEIPDELLGDILEIPQVDEETSTGRRRRRGHG